MNFLSKRGISYAKTEGADVLLKVGSCTVQGFDEKAYVAALQAAGYPDKSDPAQRKPWLIVLCVALLVDLVGAYLWASCGNIGRNVSGADPLYLDVDPLSFRHGLFRRLFACNFAVDRR